MRHARMSWLALLSLLAGTLASASEKYPSSFLWGAALSAHQTEGNAGGGENSDWWLFERSHANGKSPIVNGDTTAVAVDHWNRYSEDFSHARDMGLNTVRISIAWEKIEPTRGTFSLSAIQHYIDVLKDMRAKGLRPMVALHHFTHPQWFHERGGWTREESAIYFLRYAHFVVENLAPFCDLWITFNEPMVLVNMGYVQGIVPPLIKDNKQAIHVALNLAKAHMMTTAMIHAVQPLASLQSAEAAPAFGVGLVNSLQLYKASNKWNPADHTAAEFIDHISNWSFIDTVVNGKLSLRDSVFISTILGSVPSMAWPDLNLISGTERIRLSEQWKSDWMGVNYYTEFAVKTSFGGVEVIAPAGKGPIADNGYVVFPEGLKEIMLQTAKRYPKLPLIVSENGLADNRDVHRSDFLRVSLKVVDDLIQNSKLNIKGYYHWSLMDNFEWLLGYTMKFGLIEIQFDKDLKRVPRPSATVYRTEIKNRQ